MAADSPARRYLPAEQRKREILEVAAPLFIEKGYEATEMVEIAGNAGVSRALLHRHFGGKQDILIAVIRHIAEVPPSSVSQDFSLPLEERIEHNVDRWLDHFESAPQLLAVTQAPIGINRDAMDVLTEVREQIIDRIVANYLGQDPVPEAVRVLLRGYVAMTLSIAYEWLWGKQITREQVRETMITVIGSLLEQVIPSFAR